MTEWPLPARLSDSAIGSFPAIFARIGDGREGQLRVDVPLAKPSTDGR
jgi:hypothetical protein